MNFLNRLSGHPIKSDLSVLYTRYAILDGGSSKCIATPDAPKNFLIKIAINMYYNLLSLFPVSFCLLSIQKNFSNYYELRPENLH